MSKQQDALDLTRLWYLESLVIRASDTAIRWLFYEFAIDKYTMTSPQVEGLIAFLETEEQYG